MNATRSSLLASFAMIALAALSLADCGISPRPEPPDETPKPKVVTTDVSQDMVNGTYGIALTGGPGTIDPAGATVRVTLLDTQDPPYDTTSLQDGSFSVEVPLVGGQQVRVQAISDGRRSEPVDFVAVNMKGKLSIAPHALGDCWTIEPAGQLDLAKTSSLRLINDCAQPLQLSAPWPRLTGSQLSAGAGQSWPLTMAPGASVNINVKAPAGQGSYEEVLFIQTDTPNKDRRPITVYRDAN